MNNSRHGSFLNPSTSSKQNKINERIEMLYLREEERKARLDHIREEKEAREMAECTFAPNTMPDKLNKSHRGFRTRYEDHDIVDRLYAPQKTKYEILEEMRKERE